MPIVRFLLPFLMFLSSKAGAQGAGATGAALAVAVGEGAIPVPDGLPLWQAALLATVGPAIIWSFARIIASAANFFVRRRDNRRRRLAELLALPIAERGEDSGKHMRRLADEADRADEIAAALEPWRTPVTQSGGAR